MFQGDVSVFFQTRLAWWRHSGRGHTSRIPETGTNVVSSDDDVRDDAGPVPYYNRTLNMLRFSRLFLPIRVYHCTVLLTQVCWGGRTWTLHLTRSLVVDQRTRVCTRMVLLLCAGVNNITSPSLVLYTMYLLLTVLHLTTVPLYYDVISCCRYVTDACVAITICISLFMFPSQPPNFMCCRRKNGKWPPDDIHTVDKQIEIRECSFEKCWGGGRKTGAKPARNSCDPPPKSVRNLHDPPQIQYGICMTPPPRQNQNTLNLRSEFIEHLYHISHIMQWFQSCISNNLEEQHFFNRDELKRIKFIRNNIKQASIHSRCVLSHENFASLLQWWTVHGIY